MSFRHFCNNFGLNLVFDVSFLKATGCVFYFRIKLQTIEPLLQFDSHFSSRKRLWVLLSTMIGTFSNILRCLFV